MTNLNDIIIALATPPGVGAIAVIRLSGNGCISMTRPFFKSKNLPQVESHTIHFGKLTDENNKVIDEVLISVFKNPKSYTKEDTIEISCHGSQYIIQQILNLFLRNGARMAKQGEFTLRAFLNGQLDLSQAEAVADLIASDNEKNHELALKQMRGGFSNEIKKLRQELIDFGALLELELDFGEEDVEFADRGKLVDLIEKIKSYIHSLLQSFQLGNVVKTGVSTAIVGKPNAGKSTLLNALLNEERAIVSTIAGTTRDTIEEGMNINGILFRLTDTAGLREAQDTIEKIGIEKTKQKIEAANIVVYVFDVTTTTPEEVQAEVNNLMQQSDDHSRFLLVANKMDLNPYTKPEQYYNDVITQNNLITTSAINNMNIEYLKEKLFSMVVDENFSFDKTIVTNARHYDVLNKTYEALDASLRGFHTGITGDFIAMDIRRAMHYLGEITGEISSEDLLDSIFSRFCIGK